MKYYVYSDGSTRNNGRANAVGAWAYVILDENGQEIFHDCQAERGTTNQRMELIAAINSLDYLFYHGVIKPFDSVVLHTDSAYLHNCYRQHWWWGWLKNGWKNAKKEPVANKELWEALIEYFEKPEVEFIKVKGHADNEWNNYVDELAQNASRRLQEEKE